MTYAIAKAAYLALDATVTAASARLNAVPGISSGPMGLTPDHVRALPEYQQARRAFDSAWAQMSAFNRTFSKRYAKEIRAERRERDAARNARFAVQS